MWLSKIGTFPVVSAAIFLSAAGTTQVAAMDFLAKRECMIVRPSRAPVHTRCVISGGMMNGRIDVAIKTPDGKIFALEGPIDGASGTDGFKYLLENRPARKSDDVGDSQCYRRVDARLELCIGKLAE